MVGMVHGGMMYGGMMYGEDACMVGVMYGEDDVWWG